MGLFKQLAIQDGLLFSKDKLPFSEKQRARGREGRGSEKLWAWGQRQREKGRDRETHREKQRETKKKKTGRLRGKDPWTGHFGDLPVEQPPLVLLRESVLPIFEPTLLRILSISLGMFCFSSFSVSRW